jgi:hypothetical protein
LVVGKVVGKGLLGRFVVELVDQLFGGVGALGGPQVRLGATMRPVGRSGVGGGVDGLEGPNGDLGVDLGGRQLGVLPRTFEPPALTCQPYRCKATREHGYTVQE